MPATNLYAVMPGLVPGIHAFSYDFYNRQVVDGRDKPGHDELKRTASYPSCPRRASHLPVAHLRGLSFVMPGTRVRPKAGPSTCFMPGIHVLTTLTQARVIQMEDARASSSDWRAGSTTDAGSTVAFLHRLHAEVPFFVFAQMAVVRAQVFMRSAA
jgi:hypothetical protein